MTRALLTRFLPLALAALLPLSAAAQEEDLQWIYNRYVAENPLDTYLGLVYGIPETDAMRASIHCAIGANWIYAAVDLGADVEGLADEASATVALNAGGRDFVEQGSVFRHEEGIWGVSLALELSDPFWAELSRGGVLTYRVNDRAPETLPLDGIGAPLHAFLGDCVTIGDLPADAATDGAGAPAGK
ncbi:hypothetical protein [Pararhodobacter aggregans]